MKDLICDSDRNRVWMFTLLPWLSESFVSHGTIWRNQAESAWEPHVTRLSSKPAQAPASWASPSFTVRDPSERLSLYLPCKAALQTDFWSPSQEQLRPKTMRVVTVMTGWWPLKFLWLLLSRRSSASSMCVISFLHRTAAIVDPVTYMFETQGS